MRKHKLSLNLHLDYFLNGLFLFLLSTDTLKEIQKNENNKCVKVQDKKTFKGYIFSFASFLFVLPIHFYSYVDNLELAMEDFLLKIFI